MSFLGIVLVTVFLPGAARRSIHIGESYHDAQQQTNTVAKTLEESAEAGKHNGRHYGHLEPHSFVQSLVEVSKSDVEMNYKTKLLPSARLPFRWRVAPHGDVPVFSGPHMKASLPQSLFLGGFDVGSSGSSISRRSLMGAAAAAAVASMSPASAVAESSKEVRKALVVKPGSRELLAPMYNIRRVLLKIKRELEPEVASPSTADSVVKTSVPPQLFRAVESFAKSDGFFSDKGFIRAICKAYVDDIKYDDFGGTDLDVIAADRQMRLDAVEQVIVSLEKATDVSNSGVAEFTGLITKASEGVDRFLAMVPPEDVKAYDDLVKAVRSADMNLDGKLTGQELLGLTEDERELYNKVSAILIIYT